MNEDTVRALNAINRRFYGERADEFDQTRERAWSGWTELFDRYGDLIATSPRVLDLGCGNGRFARFLRNRDLQSCTYYGVDASPLGLEHARRRLADRGNVVWLEHDFIIATHPVPPEIASERFDLIVLFGVLHHVPGETNRARLLTDLAGRLAPGGVFVYTVWNFDRFERFTRKLVSWEEFLRTAPASERMDPRELETGDHIMTWGDSKPAHRFCHAMSDEEAESLVRTLPLQPLPSFTGDNGLNDYYVFTRAGASPE